MSLRCGVRHDPRWVGPCRMAHHRRVASDDPPGHRAAASRRIRRPSCGEGGEERATSSSRPALPSRQPLAPLPLLRGRPQVCLWDRISSLLERSGYELPDADALLLGLLIDHPGQALTAPKIDLNSPLCPPPLLYCGRL